MSPLHRRPPRSARAAALWLLLPFAVSACGEAPAVSPEDQVAIATLLGNYLPRLADAYRSGDLTILEGLASEKEIAELDKRISDLAAEGRDVRPTFESFDIEDVTVWSHSNAFVTTIEVWDLRVYASGTDQLLSEVDDQRNRVKYQLKRREDGWQVLYRQIVTTFE
jgi:hypothetical protein